MGFSVKLHWMEGREKGGYVTWGVPWKKGAMTADTGISPSDGSFMDTEPIAYWEDGSVKWTSHTAKVGEDGLTLTNQAYAVYGGNTVTETDSEITVDNDLFKAVFPKSGETLMKTPYADASLKVLKETRTGDGCCVTTSVTPYIGEIETAEVEKRGAVRTVIKVTGTHKNADGDSFLRFIVRFSLYNGEPSVKLTHTFLYDGDDAVDFIKGAGVVFTRKMTGKLYNRRIKITGDCGVMHECMQILNLWRPRLGPSIGIFETARGRDNYA